MKKKWLKKGSAMLLTAAMVLALFPGTKGAMRVQAAENTEPTSEYWTDVNGLRKFSLDGTSNTEGRIIFGQNESGAAQQWKIAGTDSGFGENNIILFAASPLGRSVFEDNDNTNKSYDSNWNCTYPYDKIVSEVLPNHYGASDLRTVLNTYMSDNRYFSVSEKTKMNRTKIYTDDTKNDTTYSVRDTLYAPYGVYGDKYITVGSKDYDNLKGVVKIDTSKWGNDNFWLRSSGSGDGCACVACPGNSVIDSSVDFDGYFVVPAFDLNLSSVLFASAADAAPSSYSGFKANDTDNTMTANTYTLRYESSGSEEALISSDGTKIKVTNAKEKYLMVQNNNGVYVLAIDDNSKTVNASDIVMGSDTSATLTNFNNCKVWIESTDKNRITTAKMATQGISSVEVTGIEAPVVGSSALDTVASCTTTGVATTEPTVTWKQGAASVTGNAGYNTPYTASVTLSADDDYEFASSVTATVDGQNATSVTKNQNGTVTVTYIYKTVPKAVSNAYFATVDDLKDCYNLSDGTIGKIKFGLNKSDARLWAICGADGENLALLSTSEFTQAVYGDTSEYSKSNFVDNLKTDSNGYLSTTYFSKGEIGKMADVTVSTNEPDGKKGNHSVSVKDKKLYLPNSQDQNSHGQLTIYVGSSNNIAINLANLKSKNGFQTNYFWLRSPTLSYSLGAIVAWPGGELIAYNVTKVWSVVPAFNLKLSSDFFASAADAASPTYSGYKANDTDKTMMANIFTLRYTYTDGTDSAVINSSGTQVKVKNANGKYLMVQNDTGVYALAIDSESKTVNASDIQMGDSDTDKLKNFNNCKVWIESTDADRITTAKMAIQATTISSVEVTGIDAPVAGSALDTQAACATTGVTTTAPTVTWKQGEDSATGNAGYNTPYTASVTLSAGYDYEFASDVTAKVDGHDATSVTNNDDGTVTLTYTFPATNKAKLTSITEPTGITVANGTAYANMGLPTSVAIVTEGNTEKTAEVTWNTATPASGSYNPSVKTEQTVTLNGTVTCPDNIDSNGVALTTKIKVTISAAETPDNPKPDDTKPAASTPDVKVTYRTHVQKDGWQNAVADGKVSGTSGEAKRLEGININVTGNSKLGIQYSTHVQSYGWMPWSSNGEMSGTEGEAKRLEAIKIQLTGSDKDKYDIYYRVHAQSYGWLDWAKNGEAAGTAGLSKRLEAIQIVVVKKGESIDTNMEGIKSAETKPYVVGNGATENPVISGANETSVEYRTHVQTYGWQMWKYNGTTAGTTGQAKRLEGINIRLANQQYAGGIEYQSHVQTYGWEKTWRKNGETSGTSGQAKRLEAIRIRLTGEMAQHYDIYYRVHSQTCGWLGWAKNGEAAGTEGHAKRLEGIQIVLVKKGEAAPGSTAHAFIK